MVLVHGILGQGFVYWNLVKRYLSGDRYHFHEVRLPFFGFGDLRRSAQHLAHEVDRILDECDPEHDRNQVDLIAHSAGGLAARWYIKFLGGDARVHSLVTLGTPHQGTVAGGLFPLNTVARQTLPRSTFLRQLNRGPDTKRRIHYTCLYSKTDGVVIPATSARLKGARNVEISYATHWGFLWRRDVYQLIRDAIDHAPDSYPYYGRPASPAGARRRGGVQRSRRIA